MRTLTSRYKFWVVTEPINKSLHKRALIQDILEFTFELMPKSSISTAIRAIDRLNDAKNKYMLPITLKYVYSMIIGLRQFPRYSNGGKRSGQKRLGFWSSPHLSKEIFFFVSLSILGPFLTIVTELSVNLLDIVFYNKLNRI